MAQVQKWAKLRFRWILRSNCSETALLERVVICLADPQVVALKCYNVNGSARGWAKCVSIAQNGEPYLLGIRSHAL